MAMGEHPDYFPKVENVKNRKYELLPSRLDQIWNQKIKVENGSYDFVEKIGEKNLSFYVADCKK